MSQRHIVFTGFPGFIGRRLIARLLNEGNAPQVTCLVQPKFLDQANADLDKLRQGRSGLKATAVAGDITDQKLGLTPEVYERLAASATEVWHLAAIYDLAVPYEFAHKVNVKGTKNILAFCGAAKNFEKLVYYSTCYVAGDRLGLIKEDELDMGQGFKNNYESTKFLAEIEIRKAMADGLAAVIIRPAIVVGDSKTGETDKFDGPYFGMRMIWKLKWLPGGLPLVGPSDAEVNLAPVDYLVDATMALARKKEAIGGAFQIVDPKPMLARDIYSQLCLWITGRPPLPFSIPAKLFEAMIIGPVKTWLGAPKQMVTYFNHKAKYDCAQTLSMLNGSGVACPPLKNYLETLYRYWLTRKDEPGRLAKA
ncbi:MAG: SDR family oxidoreductase [Elusimicrobia bacterium]|nr:SDR family oxidoreductase [Elusimicrobiota bacterium]